MTKLEIRNKQGELLEAISEGAPLSEADEIIVMVHGFGTSLHERGNYDDISTALIARKHSVATVRFTISGFGNSEGKQEEKSFITMTEDVESILHYLLENKKTDTRFNAITFSMGIHYFTKAVLNKDFNIIRVIAINPTNYNAAEALRIRFANKPETNIEANGTMVVPRGDGSITRIGKVFWDSIKPTEQKENLKRLAKQVDIKLIRAIDDDLLEYNNKEIEQTVNKVAVGIHGDHDYSNPKDRKILVEKVIESLGKK